jgi:hypothetical protein
MTQQLTLFATPHDQAVADMIALFQQQLKEASTKEERELIRLAIRGWQSTLGPPMKTSRPANRGRANRKHHG